MSASITTDFPGLKRMAKEFFDALPTLDCDGAENGFKCLTLAYLGMEGTDLDRHQAACVIRIAARELLRLFPLLRID